MTKRRIIAGAYFLVICAVLFPPWGNTSGYDYDNRVIDHPWTYCGYAFILNPPKKDEELAIMDAMINPDLTRDPHAPPAVTTFLAANMQPAWFIFLGQFLVIFLIARGLIYALTLEPGPRDTLVRSLIIVLIVLIGIYLFWPHYERSQLRELF